MEKLVADKIIEMRDVEQRVQLFKPFALTFRCFRPLVPQQRTEVLVHFCFNRDGTQALVVACEGHDIGVRRSFTAFKAHLPFRNRGKKTEPLQRFVIR